MMKLSCPTTVKQAGKSRKTQRQAKLKLTTAAAETNMPEKRKLMA